MSRTRNDGSGTSARGKLVRRLERAEARKFEVIGLRYAKARLYLIRTLLRRIDHRTDSRWKEPFPSWR